MKQLINTPENFSREGRTPAWIQRNQGGIPLTGLIMVACICAACAGAMSIERYQPLMGEWTTDKGIIMSIRQSTDGGVAAFIKATPGFRGRDIQSGKAVISTIRPLVDGGYTGLFLMPGNLKPVKVRMMFSGPDTLLIVTWDRRAQGNIMKWQRTGGRAAPSRQ